LWEALDGAVKTPCLGGIPRASDIEIPERHLGLYTSHDHPIAQETVRQLADLVEENIDLDNLLGLLPDILFMEAPAKADGGTYSRLPRVGIPRDSAFCFYYPDNLDLLEAYGAEVVFFSPLRGDPLPKALDGLYIGGGYPELFAQRLSEHTQLKQQIREESEAGMPIYAECGGFMYLCEALIDTDGKRFPMVGCFPFTTRMLTRLKALGYREVCLADDTILGKSGQVIRGHEFHYSELTTASGYIDAVYSVSAHTTMQGGREGFQKGRCLGSYIHLHFGSCPEAAGHFTAACRQYQEERISTRETRRD
jgi:cobyrinic acid a,c-diamide synthase